MNTPKWYDRKWLVYSICIFFFPLGFYGLYKSQTIERSTKYMIVGIWVILWALQMFKKQNQLDFADKEPVATKIDSTEIRAELERKRDQQPTDCYYVARRLLKDNLNDKDSYEEDTHEEYFVKQRSKKDPYIQVTIRYRAKNGFGAIMLNETVFNFDESLNMVKTYNN